MKCITIEMKGSITIGQGDVQLRNGIRDVIERGYDLILLDFSNVNYMDSSGLGELVAAHERVEKAGAHMGIFNINPKINKLLYVSLLLDKLNCFEDREAATNHWLQTA